MFLRLMRSTLVKAGMAAMFVGGLAMFGAAPNARADECNRTIRYDDARLNEAIARHGYYSRQAEHWRHERREALARCWRDRDGYWHRY